MATIFSSCFLLPSPNDSSQLHPLRCLRFQTHCRVATNLYSPRPLALNRVSRTKRIKSLAEEGSFVPVGEGEGVVTVEDASSPPPVSVSVAPSDVLTMFFRAEGTMVEADIPKVTKALEEKEGIADLEVHVFEGMASLELTKQTTMQATGVASGFVETLLGSGFKLRTLNLSFQDGEGLQ
ncbi:unnamed protein product [Cuscuta campestris]|uniref:Uncharacterized protein n=1 Tax=Cuscuta campestris TaxID=132261 RepID=A0A484KTH5_9ASTE|nr:unnamed protein product [Cuscuta campestris]